MMVVAVRRMACLCDEVALRCAGDPVAPVVPAQNKGISRKAMFAAVQMRKKEGLWQRAGAVQHCDGEVVRVQAEDSSNGVFVVPEMMAMRRMVPTAFAGTPIALCLGILGVDGHFQCLRLLDGAGHGRDLCDDRRHAICLQQAQCTRHRHHPHRRYHRTTLKITASRLCGRKVKHGTTAARRILRGPSKLKLHQDGHHLARCHLVFTDGSATFPMVMKMNEILEDGAPTTELMRIFIRNDEVVAKAVVDRVLADMLMVLVLSPITVPDMIVTAVVMLVIVV